jgi:hypothetical protein
MAPNTDDEAVLGLLQNAADTAKQALDNARQIQGGAK